MVQIHTNSRKLTRLVVDAALKDCAFVEHVLVLQRTGGKVNMKEGRDKWWHEEAEKVPAFCPCEVMNAEDPLFILYVSCYIFRHPSA